MEAPNLETEGVVVSQLRIDDADAYFCAQDDEIRLRFGPGSPSTREEALEFINNANEQWSFDIGRLRTWAIRETESGPLIGWVSLRLTDHGPEGARQHGAFLEFWAAPEARGRGLVSKAVGLVLDWASRHLDRDWVDAQAQADNDASLRLLSRFSFVEIGEETIHGVPTRRLRLNLESCRRQLPAND